MKTTIAIAVACLVSFVAVAFGASTYQAANVPITVSTPVPPVAEASFHFEGEMVYIVHTAPIVVTRPAKRTASAKPAPAKAWTCGSFGPLASASDMQVRRCEWL